MTRSTKHAALLALAALLCLVLAACGGKGTDSSSSSEPSGSGASSDTTATAAPAQNVKVGPGVTDDKISLGVMTDLTGVFAAFGKPLVHAHELYWKERNASGGVCNRTIDLVVKDHGYDPQKAVALYRDLAPDVLALQELLGSPITAALLPSLKEDAMPAVLAAWPSSQLVNDNLFIVGATYDIEMINGLDFLESEKGLKSGDAVGHIYFEGEYGENGLKGSKYYAKEKGLKLVEQKIKPTDEDMSGQVSALKKAGVKAILMTTAPTQFASAVGIAAAQGLNVPFVGDSPVFDPALLKTPAAKALEANAYVVGSLAPINYKSAKVEKLLKNFKAEYPKDDPKGSATFGYAMAKVMYEILNQACTDGDLTREGITAAARKLTEVKMGGLTAADLDYSQTGEPASRTVYISRPTAGQVGGLKALPETLESETAKAYDPSS